MTPFRVMTVPPPMCAYSLEFTSPVSSLSFCQSENKMAVLLNNGDVATYIFDNKFGTNFVIYYHVMFFANSLTFRH